MLKNIKLVTSFTVQHLIKGKKLNLIPLESQYQMSLASVLLFCNKTKLKSNVNCVFIIINNIRKVFQKNNNNRKVDKNDNIIWKYTSYNVCISFSIILTDAYFFKCEWDIYEKNNRVNCKYSPRNLAPSIFWCTNYWVLTFVSKSSFHVSVCLDVKCYVVPHSMPRSMTITNKNK